MLDVLFKIKDEMDPTLAFRRSCRYALQPSQAFELSRVESCRHVYAQFSRGLVKQRPSRELPCAGRASVGPAP